MGSRAASATDISTPPRTRPMTRAAAPWRARRTRSPDRYAVHGRDDVQRAEAPGGRAAGAQDQHARLGTPQRGQPGGRQVGIEVAVARELVHVPFDLAQPLQLTRDLRDAHQPVMGVEHQDVGAGRMACEAHHRAGRREQIPDHRLQGFTKLRIRLAGIGLGRSSRLSMASPSLRASTVPSSRTSSSRIGYRACHRCRYPSRRPTWSFTRAHVSRNLTPRARAEHDDALGREAQAARVARQGGALRRGGSGVAHAELLGADQRDRAERLPELGHQVLGLLIRLVRPREVELYRIDRNRLHFMRERGDEDRAVADRGTGRWQHRQ